MGFEDEVLIEAKTESYNSRLGKQTISKKSEPHDLEAGQSNDKYNTLLQKMFHARNPSELSTEDQMADRYETELAVIEEQEHTNIRRKSSSKSSSCCCSCF